MALCPVQGAVGEPVSQSWALADSWERIPELTWQLGKESREHRTWPVGAGRQQTAGLRGAELQMGPAPGKTWSAGGRGCPAALGLMWMSRPLGTSGSLGYFFKKKVTRIFCYVA